MLIDKLIYVNVTSKKIKYYHGVLINLNISCLIKIDKVSDNLPLGTHWLYVHDVSKKSRFGTKHIYELATDYEEIKDLNDLVSLQHNPYNFNLHDQAKSLGGIWYENKWYFAPNQKKAVEALNLIYNSKKITVFIYFKKETYTVNKPLDIFGYIIADYVKNKLFISKNVKIVTGELCLGGSERNVEIIAKQSTILQMDLPKNILDMYETETEYFKISTKDKKEI